MTDKNRDLLERLWPMDGQLALSAEAEHELRTEDYVLEMPQSGERIVGRDTMRAMQREYPAPPSIEIQRIIGEGDHFVVLGRSDYGGEIFHVANIVEFADGRIARETRIYGSPFEPPAWRAKYQ
ncbi:nuclear transport factor 2 family protein [Kribbella sp. NPDC056861]|uniref:nuclear transport factor 2 family protein n=1 Tax=Kribbella sp. NPDC056861 TaxID=3154857 RepID=UPI0034200396